MQGIFYQRQTEPSKFEIILETFQVLHLLAQSVIPYINLTMNSCQKDMYGRIK